MVGGFYDRRVLARQFSRNENSLNLRLQATAGGFSGVADLDFDWIGLAEDLTTLDAVGRPELVSPYRLQTHGLYFEGTDIIADGLDVKIGEQVVAWGAGDQFNPTNTVNPPDLENVLFFGRQVANLMVRADYAVTETWNATAVFVPIFKPALLPPTASFGLANVAQLPFLDPGLRYSLHAEREFAAENDRLHPGEEYPTVARRLSPVLPEPRIENAQWAVRLGGSLFEHDVGLSYYYGRTAFPVATASHTRQRTEEICDPVDPSNCLVGLLETDTTVRYPRMQVVGLNMAGQIDPFGWISNVFKPIGYRLEVGLYLPAARTHIITTDEVVLIGITQEEGEYDYDVDGNAAGPRPLVVDDQPFLKWVLGLDYSLGRHVYLNVMWVHGLVDEYGAGDWLFDPNQAFAGAATRDDLEGVSVRDGAVTSLPDPCVTIRPFDPEGSRACAAEVVEETTRNRIGDYLVVGADFKFFDDELLVRLFTIWDIGGITFERWDETAGERVREHHGPFSSEGVSAIVYPEIQYNFGNGLRLGLGGFIQVGERYTKFGDPAAGGSSVWTRGTFAF